MSATHENGLVFLDNSLNYCGRSFAYDLIRKWIKETLWPLPVYQVVLCLAIGVGLEVSYVSVTLDGVKNRLFYITNLCLPFINNTQIHCIVCLEFGLIILCLMVLARRYCLRRVFSYTNWIYVFDDYPSGSLYTSLWRFGLQYFNGSDPTTFCNDVVLPSLPLPSIQSTSEHLFETLTCYLGLNSPKLSEMKKRFQDFIKQNSAGSQRRLTVKRWFCGNYTTLWWEAAQFLTNRKTLLLTSSYSVIEITEKPFTIAQSARAAVVLHLYGKLHLLANSGQLSPQWFKNKAPLCMSQWKRVFATNRVAALNNDELWTYPPLRIHHAVVVHGGRFYKLSVFSNRGRIISPACLQRHLDWIISDVKIRSESEGDLSSSSFGYLTILDRNKWGSLRSQFFSSGGNKETLIAVEEALCVISLDDKTWTDSPDSVLSNSLTGHQGLAWFDKTVNFVISASGHLSVLLEQSALDVNVAAYLLERLFLSENDSMYDEHGNSRDVESTINSLELPEHLPWSYDGLEKEIASARTLVKVISNNLKVSVLSFTDYGRGRVKANGLSLDAFIQCALHVTYYALFKEYGHAAEVVPTRLFYNGRTELLRTLTNEMVVFIETLAKFAKNKETSVDAGVTASQCFEALKTACVRHRWLIRDVMTGNGVDKHLQALNIATQLRTYEKCQILDEILEMPWDFYTCKIPLTSDTKSWMFSLPPPNVHAYSVTYHWHRQKGFEFCITEVNNSRNLRAANFSAALSETLKTLSTILE